MSFTLNSSPVQSLTLKLPRWGIWTARAKLAADTTLADGAAITLVLGDLTLTGVKRSGGVFQSSAEYFLVGGADGWSKPVKKRSYRTDAGVKLSQVAIDLGKDAGERVVLTEGTDRSLGYAWPRPAGTASAALDALRARWWVAPDGTTYLGARSSAAIAKTVKWSLESFDPANRIAICGVSADAFAAFQPGVQLTAPGMDIVVGSVVMTVTDRRVVVEAWGL